MVRIKKLWEAYLDLVLMAARIDDHEYGNHIGVRKQCLHPPMQRCEWTPWRLWEYTGYAPQKMQQLHRDYISSSTMAMVTDRIEERMKKRGPFCVNLPIGHPVSANRIEQEKRQRKHQLGECFTSISLYITPQRNHEWIVTGMVTWRTSEIIRRFGADLCFLDAIFHALLDPNNLYPCLKQVNLVHGSIWISCLSAGIGGYMFPGIENEFPYDQPLTRAWLRWERLAHEQEPTKEAIPFSPRRRATAALQALKKHKVPSMFVEPLSAKRLHPGARKSDFPHYTFG